MELRKVQVYVNDIEESKAVQELLFASGARWASDGIHGPANLKTNSSYSEVWIYVMGDGTIYKDYTEVGEDFTPLTLERKEVVTYQFKVHRPKTVLFGRTYYTDDLEAALKTLATAEI